MARTRFGEGRCPKHGKKIYWSQAAARRSIEIQVERWERLVAEGKVTDSMRLPPTAVWGPCHRCGGWHTTSRPRKQWKAPSVAKSNRTRTRRRSE